MSETTQKDDSSLPLPIGLKLIIAAVATVLIIIVLSMAGCPHYSVYKQTLAGRAQLAKAEYTKQIQVANAQAKLDAASLISNAEIERARGVAEANEIMSASLGGPQGYLRWHYIEMLSETGLNSNTIIYIPTEAGLPVLEAGRAINLRPAAAVPVAETIEE